MQRRLIGYDGDTTEWDTWWRAITTPPREAYSVNRPPVGTRRAFQNVLALAAELEGEE